LDVTGLYGSGLSGLGHTKTDTTDIYLLEEVQEAIKVAKLLAFST